MSKEYEGQDLKDIAARAEQDINARKNNSDQGGGSLSSELTMLVLLQRWSG